MGKIYQTFKEELTPIHLKFFPNNRRNGNTSKLILETSITLIRQTDTTRKLNYKPISLINTDAKLNKKILANRIQQHFKRTIHRDQVTYIPAM